MEYLLGIIVALVGGLFYFKSKSDKDAINKKLAETRSKDRDLAEQQASVEQAILDLDDGVKVMQKKRKREVKKNKKHMSLKERGEAARSRYKKK